MGVYNGDLVVQGSHVGLRLKISRMQGICFCMPSTLTKLKPCACWEYQAPHLALEYTFSCMTPLQSLSSSSSSCGPSVPSSYWVQIGNPIHWMIPYGMFVDSNIQHSQAGRGQDGNGVSCLIGYFTTLFQYLDCIASIIG
jgi:hypothetical protein